MLVYGRSRLERTGLAKWTSLAHFPPAASGTSLPHHVLCTAYGADVRGIKAADHSGLGDARGGVLRARLLQSQCRRSVHCHTRLSACFGHASCGAPAPDRAVPPGLAAGIAKPWISLFERESVNPGMSYQLLQIRASWDQLPEADSCQGPVDGFVGPCGICHEDRPLVALAPCGHALCSGCQQLLRGQPCPFCRQPVQAVTRGIFVD